VITTGSSAWRSTNGGTSWTPVTIPDAAGESATITGVSPLKTGFAAVRANGGSASVYLSADGAAWHRSATLATASGAALTLGSVSGGPSGAVVTGEANGLVIAFISADGTTWTGTDPVGTTAAAQVSGVALTNSGRAVLAGTSGGTGSGGGQQPALSVIGAQGGPDHVNLAAVPGAESTGAEVSAIASASATDVAAGSADGAAALWTSADGGSAWTRGTGTTPGTLTRAGTNGLTSVAHGTAGWLAVGGALSGASGNAGAASGNPAPAAGPPVVLGSAAGTTWTAEDGEAAFTGNGVVTAGVAAGPGGNVIVGRQVMNGQSIAVTWFSQGLTGWQRGSDAQPGALEGGGNLRMNAVTATARGFAAVGSDGTKPAAWQSANGRSWSKVPLPLPSGTVRANLSYVAANGATVAAAGTAATGSGQQVPFAAISANGGASWSQVLLPIPQNDSGAATVTALTAAGGGFTATGTSGQNVIVWLTAKGSTSSASWTAASPNVKGLSGPGTQAITGLASSGTTLTGVGFTATAATYAPTIWQAPVRG
jgi:hypothetical protein